MKPDTYIPFLDLKAVNQRFEPQLSQSALQVVRAGQYLVGEHTEKFEQEFGAYIGTRHVLAVSNGTNALELILRGYREQGLLQPNDEILVPANTFIATFLAIVNQGMVPVPVDPDLQTFLPDLPALKRSLGTKTKALVLVHLYGRTAYSEAIAEWANSQGLLLIEDNAQAVGNQWNAKKTGSLGHAAAHSFYPTKNLGALGDAGAVTTDDPELAACVRALAHYGSTEKYRYAYTGFNFRMDEIQAAALRVKLPHLDRDNQHRALLAARYLERLSHPDLLLPEPESRPFYHTWHLFTVLTEQRDSLRSYLASQGIETAIHYPVPPHRQPAFASLLQGYRLPVTEKIHRQTLSLPLHPALSEEQQDYIITCINRW